jgi:hypothetical protein
MEKLTLRQEVRVLPRKVKAQSKVNRESRAVVKRASRRSDAVRLKNGERPEVLQRENSIFPAGFFDNARISNLKQAIGR